MAAGVAVVAIHVRFNAAAVTWRNIFDTFANFKYLDSKFMTWDTRIGRIGVAICWDQWFPEAARAMALAGAELIFYPTAIGSEPPSGQDTRSLA